MPKRILFDIDDTLFPTTEFAELARRNAIRAMIEMGMRKSENELHAMLMAIIAEKGSNYPNHFNVLCARLKEKRPARFVAAAVGAYHNTKTSIQPFPAVPSTLLSLREAGHKIYVATNGEATKQWDKLIRLQIALFFEDVFVSEELGEEKGPSFFRKVVKRLGAKPGDCVMVGDREDADIIPAKAVGMHTIRMKTGRHAAAKSSAEFQANDFRDIPKIIKGL
jgi:putative hydrolase of the HAD superfamily